MSSKLSKPKGKRKVKGPKQEFPCPNKWCDRKFGHAGHLAKHRIKCDRNGAPAPSKTYTLSPDEKRWPNSKIMCIARRGMKNPFSLTN